MFGSRWIIFFAAISGLVCVGIGAMGSHSLPKRLQESGLSESDIQRKIAQCEIAVKYQIYHTLAALAIGLCPATATRRVWKIACILFFMGVCLFSGGLYSLVFFDRMGHWSIVPLGGATLMVAWLSLAISAIFPIKSDLGTGKFAA